jgi:diguanylate cyclase (GGDEF)-like protein
MRPSAATKSMRMLISAGSLVIGATVGLVWPLAFAWVTDRYAPPEWVAVFGGVGLSLGFVLRHVSLRRLELIIAGQKAESLRFYTAINNMSQGLCFFDGRQRLIVCNDRYAEMYKLSPDQVRPGTTLIEIVDHRYAAGCFPDMTRDAYLRWRASIVVADKPSDTVTALKDGRTFAIHHRPMADGGWVATHEDITERRRAQAEIEHMARHDALTGLANRVLFRERLTELLQAGDRDLAVMCLDLDRFKPVNDALGHPAGDQLLRDAAQRLVGCAREGDVVARLGGDEFAVIQVNGSNPAAASVLADRLLRAIGAPFDIGGQQVMVGTSIGIALAPADSSSPDELLKKADLALYDAKTRGRGVHSFFKPELDRRAQGRRALESDLREAADKGQLELHYQPMISLRDDKLLAFEALVRWHHPQHGMVMPDAFIPLAEETGLIEELGIWVLNRACIQAATWPDHLAVAVNLSPLQLNGGGLVAIVRQALTASGLAPARLELEITESLPLAENSINLATLHGLRALGVRISLDDFGAGYSSVGYLRSFPFDTIKIDRSFVREVTGNREAAAIVRAMATLGSSLGMAITAEGVETDEQLRTVRALGCTQAQGYLINTPRPANELPAIIKLDRRFVVVARDAEREAS